MVDCSAPRLRRLLLLVQLVRPPLIVFDNIDAGALSFVHYALTVAQGLTTQPNVNILGEHWCCLSICSVLQYGSGGSGGAGGQVGLSAEHTSISLVLCNDPLK